jgi:endonuclease/exonuclease/phosphatase family metal-dependent hydrolase
MNRIMTYNVHRCVGVDGRLDVERIAQVIAQCRPDVVALQELDVGRRRTGNVDQAHEIAEQLGMKFHFHPAFWVEEEAYGDAILTACPVRLCRAGPLPGIPRFRQVEPRGALWVKVELGGVEVDIVNTHLGLVPQEQRAQASALVGEDWLGHPDCTDPAILLGDFNATPHHTAYRRLAAKLGDAQRVAGKRRSVKTFPSRMPVLRIDHVFVSRSIRIAGVHAPKGPVARMASDHLPLVVDFRGDRKSWH